MSDKGERRGGSSKVLSKRRLKDVALDSESTKGSSGGGGVQRRAMVGHRSDRSLPKGVVLSHENVQVSNSGEDLSQSAAAHPPPSPSRFAVVRGRSSSRRSLLNDEARKTAPVMRSKRGSLNGMAIPVPSQVPDEASKVDTPRLDISSRPNAAVATMAPFSESSVLIEIQSEVESRNHELLSLFRSPAPESSGKRRKGRSLGGDAAVLPRTPLLSEGEKAISQHLRPTPIHRKCLNASVFQTPEKPTPEAKQNEQAVSGMTPSRASGTPLSPYVDIKRLKARSEMDLRRAANASASAAAGPGSSLIETAARNIADGAQNTPSSSSKQDCSSQLRRMRAQSMEISSPVVFPQNDTEEETVAACNVVKDRSAKTRKRRRSSLIQIVSYFAPGRKHASADSADEGCPNSHEEVVSEQPPVVIFGVDDVGAPDPNTQVIDSLDPYTHSLQAARAQQLALGTGSSSAGQEQSANIEFVSPLRSGSLLALLGWMTRHCAEIEAEMFFLAHDHWNITGSQLFNAFLELYNFGCPWDNAKPSPKFLRNTMLLLLRWITLAFQADFQAFEHETGASLRRRVTEFLHSVQLSRDGLSAEATQVQLQFLQSELELEEYLAEATNMLQRGGAGVGVTPSTFVPHSPMKLVNRLSQRMGDNTRVQQRVRQLSILAVKPTDLALQMTRIDFSLFAKIPLTEIAGLKFNASNKREAAPRIMAVVDRWNQVAGWVATEIVLAAQKDKLNVLKRFVMLADQLLTLSNFASLLAVMAGLNLHAVTRLTTLWSQLPEKYSKAFERLSRLISSQGNYRNYRELYRRARGQRGLDGAIRGVPLEQAPAAAGGSSVALPAAAAGAAASGASVPVVPYVGLYMRDFTFVDDGNASYLENGHINFEKVVLWGRLLREIREVQRQSCSIQENAELANYLTNLIVCSEESLYSTNNE